MQCIRCGHVRLCVPNQNWCECTCNHVILYITPLSLQRFGVALVSWGQVDLKKREFASDFEPIDKNCPCVACTNHSRAYIHSLMTQKETVACNLVSLHNVCYMVSGWVYTHTHTHTRPTNGNFCASALQSTVFIIISRYNK